MLIEYEGKTFSPIEWELFLSEELPKIQKRVIDNQRAKIQEIEKNPQLYDRVALEKEKAFLSILLAQAPFTEAIAQQIKTEIESLK
jgi:hypothetical protein